MTLPSMDARRRARRRRSTGVGIVLAALCGFAGEVPAFESAPALADRYAREVDRRIDPPPEERRNYGDALVAALQTSDRWPLPAQYAVLVDRSPHVQAVMVFWIGPDGSTAFIGASPASTGKPGKFEHFLTPLGVFDHTIEHPDFRALGTRNDQGVRGYGIAGMRVFDFGWVAAPKTWAPGEGVLRLQVHATDPTLLEPTLGERRSKGCIRIPAALDVLLDRYGVLDADYERAMRENRRPWVMRADRAATPWSGRYLVVIESGRTVRPDWVPPPARRAR